MLEFFEKGGEFRVRLLHPWFLILLPLGLFLVFRMRKVAAAFYYSFTQVLKPQHWLIGLFRVVFFLVIVALILALARPVVEGGTVPRVTRVRDTVILIDKSASMDEGYDDSSAVNGKKLSKYEVSRLLAAEFIKSRPDDRIMVCVFDSEIICPMPLTKDHEILLEWLYSPDSIGGATYISSAMVLSLKHLEEMGQEGKRTIILLSDGEETMLSWTINVELQILEMLKKNNVVFYWIYVDSQEKINSRRKDNSWDPSQLSLKRFAVETGGKMVDAGSEKAFGDAIKEILHLSTKPVIIRVPVASQDLYQFFVSGAVAILFLSFLWINLRIR